MEEIQEILKLLNPWWKENLISQELARPYKREIFPKISGLINYRQIVILSGLRRVGKTTLLYQIIELLIKKINSKKILYFNFDKKVEEIIEILESYQKLVNINWKKEKMFVFLDEITRLNEWATKLKMLYDAFPNLKFFISSSGSLSLEEEAIKNLGGRYFIFNIKPLSFKEYLELKNKKNMLKEASLFEKEIKEEIESYLLRSFPEIVNWEDELLIKDYLRSTIIDRIVKSDL
ncbi:MAG TPA: AAA family ATPase, partial [Candidatus Nanoarchaeia archaeon]|nr:AAA family ATPase [Candidatus Nanoarchaeia archaeon]